MDFWSALCGDPDPSLPGSPPVFHIEYPWPSSLQHNGPYDIAVTVDYEMVSFDFLTLSFQTEILHASDQMTIDLENMILTPIQPANPDVAKWDPDASQAPVPFTAAITSAYRDIKTVTLRIYDSAQNLMKTFQQSLPIGPSTSVSFQWDGSMDTPFLFGSPVFLAPKGIYLFQWDVGGVNIDTSVDSDAEKSAFLHVSTTGIADEVSDDGAMAVYNVSYRLDDSNGKPALAGKIDVYDPSLQIVFSRPFAQNELALGEHGVRMEMPSPKYGVFRFLVTAQDHDDVADKGHRNRYALQHNQQNLDKYQVAFAHEAMHDEPRDFKTTMSNMGFHAIAWAAYDLDDWYYQEDTVSVKRMRGALTYVIGGVKPLKVAMFGGHGDPEGMAIIVKGAQMGNPLGDCRLLVTTKAYHANPQSMMNINGVVQAIQPLSGLDLNTVAPLGPDNLSLPTALSNLDLVLLVACYQGTTGTGLCNEFLALGAKCVVRIGANASELKCEELFLTALYSNSKKKSTTIAQAVATALKSARDIINNPSILVNYGPDGIEAVAEGPGKNVVFR